MSIITQVNITENVAVVSFENTPAHIGFLSGLFDKVAKAKINVDMISQTAPKGEKNSISFTVSDDKVPDMMKILTELKAEQKGLHSLISSGNTKICLYGEEMPSKVGVAADAFVILNSVGIDVLLITTSDMDISIVVTSADADKAYEALKEAYLK